MIRVCLVNLSSRQVEWLDLPASGEELELMKANLGVKDFSECNYRSAPDLEDYLPRSWNVEELNALASTLERKGIGDFEKDGRKLLAVLEAELPETMSQMQEIAEHLEDYSVLPDEIETPADYARCVIREGKVPLDERIAPFLDYDAFGRNQMHTDGVVQTSQGAVVCNTHALPEFPEELTTLRLYSPLRAGMYVKDEWGNYPCYPEEVHPNELCRYEEAIRRQIGMERLDSEGERGLAVYLGNKRLERKVHSLSPDVEAWEGELWGVLEVKSHGELQGTELDALKGFWSGQASDGWGEGFEQREIATPDGDLCVSFWNAEDYQIQTEQELKGQHTSDMAMQMGGI
ncbi:MAG: antirestriction protein ArdA [Lachnospiraceae bacterium]|nr:antirestriction protein ArdA [Lachnospiraceae bacterium]